MRSIITVVGHRVIPSAVGELVKRDSPEKVQAWYCLKCGNIYPDHNGAALCCAEFFCDDCDNQAWSKWQHHCAECLAKFRLADEIRRLAKAEAIPAKDYPDKQGVFFDGEYHTCLDAFLDHCEMEKLEVPARVWSTEPETFALNADDILDAAWEDFAEGCEDAEMTNIVGEAELRTAVEAFNKAQTLTLYWECDKAVDLGQ